LNKSACFLKWADLQGGPVKKYEKSMWNLLKIVGFTVLVVFSTCSQKNKMEMTEKITDFDCEEIKQGVTNEELVKLKQIALKAFVYINPKERNIETGEFYQDIVDNSFVKNTERIKAVEITIDDTDIFKHTYSNGLIASEYSTAYEEYDNLDEIGTYKYEYDDNDRIIRCGFWTIVYPEENNPSEEGYKRDVYLNGVKYYTEMINTIESGYEIIRYDFSNKALGPTRFVMENDRLKEIVLTDGGRPFYWYLYTYDADGNLTKIEVAWHDKNTIVETREVVERKGAQIIKVEQKTYDEEQDKYHLKECYYSGYDEYGNWTKSETYINGELNETVIRKIEYIE
jgi:hypothetical protein